MRTQLLIAMSGAVLAANGALAAGQPSTQTAHFKPFVSAASPPGADDTPGMAILSAVVDFNATVVRGAGATGGVHLGTGSYEVDFNRDVSSCTYNIALGTTGAGTVQGTADVASRSGNPNGIFVETRDLTGAASDETFHALVFCAK